MIVILVLTVQHGFEMKLENIWSQVVRTEISKKGGYEDAVASIMRNGGPFYNWHRLAMPESPCERLLADAVHLAFGDRSHKCCLTFLNWAVEAADRAFRDPRFQVASENTSKGWMNRPMYPGILGEVRVVKAFADAMLAEREIDLAALSLGWKEIAESALMYKGRSWEDTVQATYLFAVRVAMIAGDWLEANRLLRTKRKFDEFPFLHQFLSDVVAAVVEKGMDNFKRDKAEWFDAHFDAIRMPSDLSRVSEHSGRSRFLYVFEMALIRQRLFGVDQVFPRWDQIWRDINRPAPCGGGE